MKRILIWFHSLLVAIILSCCQAGNKKVVPAPSQPLPTQTPSATKQQNDSPPSSPVTPTDEWLYASEIFITGDKLTVDGYDILKMKRRLPESEGAFDVSYAAIRRNARIIAIFDGHPVIPAHSIDIASLHLLGKQSRQVIVSQTEPRGGIHWIVDLSSGCHVIFDSGEYEVGREDIGFRDLDDDGIYELSMPVVSFYMVFSEPSMADTPLPEVIFKYSRKRRRYEPANHLFQSRLLDGIEEREMNQQTTYPGAYLGARLGILLDYLYAGKEQKGWSFFRQQYRPPAEFNLPDRRTVEAKVRNVLRRSPAYKLIRRNAAAAGR